MRVGVGSQNPVKVGATEATFASIPGAAVEGVRVESGVSEQPRGETETVRGAKNRARNVLAAADYDLGVGLEGGVAEIADLEGLYLVMWAAVTDGTTWGVGAGPRLRLPDSVAARVRDGEELGPVMNDLLGTDDVAETVGAAGVLTGELIDRQEALEHALACALGPFVTDFY